MSGLYYVFLKWSSANGNAGAAQWGRYMLCFPSRYDADELFREMQTLPSSNKGDIMFRLLKRHSPQFWVYDSSESWYSIRNIQTQNQLPGFRDRFSMLLLPGFDSDGIWPIIANPVTGPDWVSGGSFFIRNRRQNDLYWYVHDDHIHTSNSHRSKFRITKTAPGNIDTDPLVLIRDDDVTVQAVKETLSSCITATSSEYVSIDGDTHRHLVIGATAGGWRFGAFLNKEIGVRWEVYDEHGPNCHQGFLAHMEDGGGDEWELV